MSNESILRKPSICSNCYHNPYKESEAGCILNGKYCFSWSWPCVDAWFWWEILPQCPKYNSAIQAEVIIQGRYTQFLYCTSSAPFSLSSVGLSVFYSLIHSTDIYRGFDGSQLQKSHFFQGSHSLEEMQVPSKHKKSLRLEREQKN